MKMGISSGFFGNLNPYEMAEKFIECGIYNTEISEKSHYTFFNNTNEIHEYKRFIDGLGFAIPQGHLPFMNEGNITSLDNTYAIDNLKKVLDIFYELGVKAAVIHYSNFGTDVVPVEEWFDVRIDALKKLTDYIKDTDMVICLENLSRIHDYDAGHLLKMCKAVDSKNIGICLDTGHLNISQRGNQYDFIMQAGSYLKAMHVHDNKGEHDGMKGLPCDTHSFPFDGGNVNFEDVKRGVRDLNYQGLFSFETAPYAPPELKMIQARYLRDMYDAYFAF